MRRGAPAQRAMKPKPAFPARQMLVLGMSRAHLMPVSENETKRTPFCPFRGGLCLLTITALCRICEPIAFMSIFPYIYYMVEDFGVPKNEISFYAGMVTSAFTFAEFSTGMLWGRLSDKIGRKPVLLTGLAGTALSVLAFGFAPNIWVALIARALGGLLNG